METTNLARVSTVLETRHGTIPAIGLGTWQLLGEACRNAVRTALEAGYRHIDTAQTYDNESEIGHAITDSGIPREELFIATKIPPSRLDASLIRKATEDSLRRLRLDHVDLLLIHWPSHRVPLKETLAAMNELRNENKIKHIGVSNFDLTALKEAERSSEAPIFCDQVEYHPYMPQEELLEYCGQSDIFLVAYSPLCRGRVFSDKTIKRIGEHHGKNPAQITLRWLIQQQNVAAIPKASDIQHMRTDLDVFDFELSDEEMKQISGLHHSGVVSISA